MEKIVVIQILGLVKNERTFLTFDAHEYKIAKSAL